MMVYLMEVNLLTCSKQQIYKHILYITKVFTLAVM